MRYFYVSIYMISLELTLSKIPALEQSRACGAAPPPRGSARLTAAQSKTMLPFSFGKVLPLTKVKRCKLLYCLLNIFDFFSHKLLSVV